MEKTIRNFIFDLGGVLVDVDKERSIEAFKKLGVAQAEQCISIYKQSGAFSELERGEISAEVFCRRVRHMTQENISDKQITDAWNAMLGEILPWKLELLLALRKRYLVYLLSNTNAIHWEVACQRLFRYKGFDVNDFFEEIYLSFQMHLVKPSKEIFQATLNCAGLLPGETMLIDDSPENCEAARALGMQAYCVKPNEVWRHLFE